MLIYTCCERVYFFGVHLMGERESQRDEFPFFLHCWIFAAVFVNVSECSLLPVGRRWLSRVLILAFTQCLLCCSTARIVYISCLYIWSTNNQNLNIFPYTDWNTKNDFFSLSFGEDKHAKSWRKINTGCVPLCGWVGPKRLSCCGVRFWFYLASEASFHHEIKRFLNYQRQK